MSRRALLALACLALATTLRAQAPSTAGGKASDTANASQVVGPPKGPRLSGEALDAETRRVALLLRCPVCQGLSVGESPSSMALNMREQVRELVAAGYDDEQVLRYFEASYGEFVRLQPPLRGVNWIVWLAPIAGLVVGGIVVVWALRSGKKPSAAAVSTDAEAAPAPVAPSEPAAPTLADDPELLPYLLRVREQAYGWPGGVPPKTSSSAGE